MKNGEQNQKTHGPGTYLAEVLAALLLISPFGSALGESRWAEGVAGAVVVLVAVSLWPWLVRLLPGPKPWEILFRPGAVGFFVGAYYGVLAALLLIAYRVLLALGLWSAGFEVGDIINGVLTAESSGPTLVTLILSLSAGVFFFVYVQPYAERSFGPRAGTLVGGSLYAVCAGFPVAGWGAYPGGIPRWVLFAALYLPTGIGLAYLRARTGSSVGPVTALVLTAAGAAFSAVVFKYLGWVAFLLAAVVWILISCEILITELARVLRFIGGLTKMFLGKTPGEEPASVADAFLLTAAAAGLIFLARTVDFFFYRWYITLSFGVILLVGSAVPGIIRALRHKPVDRGLAAAENDRRKAVSEKR